MSYTCEVFFNDVSQGTIEIHKGEYPEEAAKFMMQQLNVKRCQHVTVLCEAINARYELYDCKFDIFGSFIRTIYSYDLKQPYHKKDGLCAEIPFYRSRCDQSKLVRHHTCFRRIVDYVLDDRGVPILAFCEKHYPKGEK